MLTACASSLNRRSISRQGGFCQSFCGWHLCVCVFLLGRNEPSRHKRPVSQTDLSSPSPRHVRRHGGGVERPQHVRNSNKSVFMPLFGSSSEEVRPAFCESGWCRALGTRESMGSDTPAESVALAPFAGCRTGSTSTRPSVGVLPQRFRKMQNQPCALHPGSSRFAAQG